MRKTNSKEPRNDFAFDIRRKIQSVTSKIASKLGLRKFDPEDFKIEHIDVTLPELPIIFRNYVIIHISDIHFGQWISSDRLSGVVELINETNPDLVAITGDFVSYLLDDYNIAQMTKQLKKLKPKDATVAVLGNHDYWAGAEKVRDILKKSNIYDISNNIYTVSKEGAELNIVGIDSAMLKQDRMDIVLKKLPFNEHAVLLVHEPDFAVKSAATKRFSLQLSGHSHGGQFVIPGFGTPFRGRLFMKYPLGKYKVEDMVLYTNRGLGTNGYWLRINCPPEITVISLF
jgi:predicted MPP superfamily phosphohydrolase